MPPMVTVSKPTTPFRNSPSPYVMLKFLFGSLINVVDWDSSKPDEPKLHVDCGSGELQRIRLSE
jgi:hypothetical protein